MTSRANGLLVGYVLVASLGVAGNAYADPAPGSAEKGFPTDGIILVLLDRTGSMSLPGAQCLDEAGLPAGDGSLTKWSCAVNKARADLQDIDNGKNGRYFLWDYSERDSSSPPFWSVDGNGQDLATAEINDDLALNKDALRTALGVQGARSPSGTTPLAGAFCDAFDKLRVYRPDALKADMKIYMRVYSDGLENATKRLGLKCSGDNSATPYAIGEYAERVDLTYWPSANEYIETADGLTVPSWQSNMLDRAVTGTTHEPDPNDQNVPKRVRADSLAFYADEPVNRNNLVAEITFFDDWISSPLADAATLRALASDQPGQNVGGSATTLANPNGIAFLKGLAEITGGRLTVFGGTPTPGDPTAPHATPGDADNSGCVDLADYNLLKQYYGQRISPTDPQSYAADINYDGAIDLADYLLLQTQYGQGCASPPAPMPLLQQVIFGFDSLASWSSDQAPLSLARLPRTEGDYAMNVGGKGLRIIKTADLDTSIFEGVAAHLALDVAPPTSEADHHFVGEVLLFASCPSAHVYYMPLGVAELTGRPLGAYSTVKFTVPWLLRRVMSQSHSDLSFTIALMAHDPGFLFDNLRFVP